jgi:Mn2+/Fe2+ NRAMP family transporter
MIMLISNDRQIMKSKANGPVSQVLGWLTTMAMTIAAIALALS